MVRRYWYVVFSTVPLLTCAEREWFGFSNLLDSRLDFDLSKVTLELWTSFFFSLAILLDPTGRFIAMQ